MHIGLIGGIGVAATDLYYRGLVAEMKARGAPLEMTIVHADAPTLVRNFEARKPEAQAEIFLRLADRLVAAGAQAMAITSIGGHFCIEQSSPVNPCIYPPTRGLRLGQHKARATRDTHVGAFANAVDAPAAHGTVVWAQLHVA